MNDRQTIDDLITIIDLCNEAPFPAILRDLHDLGHVLTGGDRMRAHWDGLRWLLGVADTSSERMSPAWPDVKRRGVELLARLEGKS